MKVQLLTVFLLTTLGGGARAQSAPGAEAPATLSAAPIPAEPLPPGLAAQRQQLEARRSALEAQQRALDADIQRLEAEARRIDPEGRLNPDQLFQLLQAREQRLSDEDNPGPYLISAFFFLLTGFLAWLVASNRRSRHLHETVRLMVEKGAEIPPGLLAPPTRKPSDLRRGIILSTSGLGLAFFLALFPGLNGAWGAGVTLFLLGVGHLIVWRLQRGRGPLAAELSPQP